VDDCQRINCTNKCLAGKNYCGKHNKYNVLEESLHKYVQSGDQFGEEICRNALMEESGNPLKPKRIKHRSGRQETSLATWTLKMLELYKQALDAILQAPVHEGEGNMKLLDQENRAKKLAEMLKPYHSSVCLMDGHGRFLLYFFREVLDQHGAARLNALNIQLVDIDPEVTAYHLCFFAGAGCANVKCLTQDITLMQKLRTTLTYFNFCGIQSSLEGVAKFIQKEPHDHSLLISWSVARGAGKKKPQKQLQGRIPKTMCLVKLATNLRKDFLTYVLLQKDTNQTLPSPDPLGNNAMIADWTSQELKRLWKCNWQDSQRRFCVKYRINPSNFSQWLADKKTSPASEKAVRKWARETNSNISVGRHAVTKLRKQA